MFGLYIHIPYCRSKCRYCDFYSTPCPDGVPEAYIDALCRGNGPFFALRLHAAAPRHALFRAAARPRC